MRTALVGSRMVNHLAWGMVRENQSCAGTPLAPERSRWETVNPDTVKPMLVPRPNWDRESEKVSAWQARFDHHIHALTRPDQERVTRIESVGIRPRNRVHRHHVEPVTLQDHLQ